VARVGQSVKGKKYTSTLEKKGRAKQWPTPTIENIVGCNITKGKIEGKKLATSGGRSGSLKKRGDSRTGIKKPSLCLSTVGENKRSTQIWVRGRLYRQEGGVWVLEENQNEPISQGRRQLPLQGKKTK